MAKAAAEKKTNFVNFENIGFTVEKSQLLKSLARLQSIVEKRNTIPILSNIKLEAKAEKLVLTATDMDISASEIIVANVAQEGSVTVPAHTTYDIVRKIPDGSQIELFLDAAKSNQLTLKSGKAKFNLPCLPASEFPSISEGQLQNNFNISAADLGNLIDKTKFAVSTEETRYYLNGIYMHVIDGKLRAVATDGHRLARVELNAPQGSAEMPGIIIPRKTVNEVRKIIEGVAGEVKISLSKSKIRFDFAETTFISKLIDGTFPDYDKVIPKANEKMLEVDTKSLNQAVDRVSTIATENKAVKFSIKPGQLTLTCTNPENGTAVEEIPAKYTADEVEIGFNYRYVLDMLTGIDGETALLQLSDSASPVLVRDPADISVLYVIMPMRV